MVQHENLRQGDLCSFVHLFISVYYLIIVHLFNKYLLDTGRQNNVPQERSTP